jgi:hypothetical protein
LIARLKVSVDALFAVRDGDRSDPPFAGRPCYYFPKNSLPSTAAKGAPGADAADDGEKEGKALGVDAFAAGFRRDLDERSAYHDADGGADEQSAKEDTQLHDMDPFSIDSAVGFRTLGLADRIRFNGIILPPVRNEWSP